MANTLKYLNHLMQNTGITPACSEEEHQAAEQIADVFRNHGFEPEIQEFNAATFPKLPSVFIGILLFVGAVLFGIGGALGVLGLLLCVVSTVWFFLERLGRMKGSFRGAIGLSQNVIAYHKATGPLASPRNRPVVVVAHYDSPRGDLLARPQLAPLRPWLVKLMPFACTAPAVLAVLNLFPFPSALHIMFWLLGIVCALVPLFNSVCIILNKFVLPYTSGSVCNKSSVAAMLGVMDAVAPCQGENEFPYDIPAEQYASTYEAAPYYAEGAADNGGIEIPRGVPTDENGMPVAGAYAPGPEATVAGATAAMPAVGTAVAEDAADEGATVAMDVRDILEAQREAAAMAGAPAQVAASATAPGAHMAPRKPVEMVASYEGVVPADDDADAMTLAEAVGEPVRHGEEVVRLLHMVPEACKLTYIYKKDEPEDGDAAPSAGAPIDAVAHVPAAEQNAPTQVAGYGYAQPAAGSQGAPAPVGGVTVPAQEPAADQRYAGGSVPVASQPVAAPVDPMAGQQAAVAAGVGMTGTAQQAAPVYGETPAPAAVQTQSQVQAPVQPQMQPAAAGREVPEALARQMAASAAIAAQAGVATAAAPAGAARAARSVAEVVELTVPRVAETPAEQPAPQQAPAARYAQQAAEPVAAAPAAAPMEYVDVQAQTQPAGAPESAFAAPTPEEVDRLMATAEREGVSTPAPATAEETMPAADDALAAVTAAKAAYEHVELIDGWEDDFDLPAVDMTAPVEVERAPASAPAEAHAADTVAAEPAPAASAYNDDAYNNGTAFAEDASVSTEGVEVAPAEPADEPIERTAVFSALGDEPSMSGGTAVMDADSFAAADGYAGSMDANVPPVSAVSEAYQQADEFTYDNEPVPPLSAYLELLKAEPVESDVDVAEALIDGVVEDEPEDEAAPAPEHDPATSVAAAATEPEDEGDEPAVEETAVGSTQVWRSDDVAVVDEAPAEDGPAYGEATAEEFAADDTENVWVHAGAEAYVEDEADYADAEPEDTDPAEMTAAFEAVAVEEDKDQPAPVEAAAVYVDEGPLTEDIVDSFATAVATEREAEGEDMSFADPFAAPVATAYAEDELEASVSEAVEPEEAAVVDDAADAGVDDADADRAEGDAAADAGAAWNDGAPVEMVAEDSCAEEEDDQTEVVAAASAYGDEAAPAAHRVPASLPLVVAEESVASQGGADQTSVPPVSNPAGGVPNSAEAAFGVTQAFSPEQMRDAQDAAVDAMMAEIDAPAVPAAQRPQAAAANAQRTAPAPVASSGMGGVRRASLFDLPDPSSAPNDPLGTGSIPVARPQQRPLADRVPTMGAQPAEEQGAAPAQQDAIEVMHAPTQTQQQDKPKAGPLHGLARLFGGRKKKDERSMSEWLGVGDDFDAKTSGREIGSWDKFEDDNAWKGGAAVLDDDLTDEELTDAIASLGDDELLGHDIWFVATGSSAHEGAGMQAFLDAHRDKLRGVFLINLECVGAGETSIVMREGESRKLKGDRRISGLLNQVSADFHVPFSSVDMPFVETDASVAMNMSLRSITVAGVDPAGPRFACAYCDEDEPYNVDPRKVETVANVVTEVIRRS